MPIPIDECQSTFLELATNVLPNYFNLLRESIEATFPAAWIREQGVGQATLLRRINREIDFPGCYVFIDKGEPIYAGISQGVVGRLFQHLTSNNHFSSSLAYYMAKIQYDPGGTREQNMADAAFRGLFENSQSRLEECSIATVEIDNAVELHLFEVYAAMELGTGEFNTFRTH